MARRGKIMNMLKKHHKPEPIVEEEYFGDEEQWDTWDPMGEDHKSSFNSLALYPNMDLESQITGKATPLPNKIGHVTICDHYARYGVCADGQYCDRIHVKPYARERLKTMQNNFQLNKNRVCITYEYLSPQDLQPDGSKLLMVSVTLIKKPNDFYILAPYQDYDFSRLAPGDLKFYIDNIQSKSNAKQVLMKIHQHLSDLFEHSYRIDNVNDDIYLSQIVACRLIDGSYWRALVVKKPDLSYDELYFKVFLFDLGIEVDVTRENIFDIRAECLSEPPMAINARLNIKPSKGELEWSEEAMYYFESKTKEPQYKLCKILDYNELDRIFTVDLLDCETKDSITQMMTMNGFAEQL